MARVEIELNGRLYAVSCEDGAEGRLSDIASFVDAKMKGVGHNKSGASETQALVLTTLMLADQIFDLRSDLAKARTAPTKASRSENNGSAIDETRYASAINALSQRIDAVIGRLVRT